LDKRLSQSRYLAGEEYSIADIITFPWLRFPERRNVNFDEFPHVKRWFGEIDARPAVQRGVQVLAENQRTGQMSDAERDVLFGKTQFAAR
jgi:GST-like protein